jgi:hypothetical protein
MRFGIFASSPPLLPRIQKRLQNQHRRHLVDDPLTSHRSMSCLIQMPMGLGRRQPLIPQVNRNPKLRPQLFCKRLRLGRLRALVPRHIQRIPHNGLGNAMFAQHPSQPFEIRSPVRAMQRKKRLRRVSQRIRDSQPNPPIAHIKPKDSRHSLAPPLRLFRSLIARNLGMDRITLHAFESTRSTVK